MSFYRHILVGFVAAAFTLPVLANDTTTSTTNSSQQPASTIELTENGVKTPAADATTTATAVSDDAKAKVSTAQDTAMPAASEGKVDVNKATVKDLMKVQGMNASKAKAIVAHRKKHGDFKSMDELSQVKGFKKMKADDMKKMTDQMSM